MHPRCMVRVCRRALGSGSRGYQVRDDERGDGVSGEDDDEADDAAKNPLFCFCNSVVVTAGCHPEETSVDDDDENDDT